MIQRIWDLRRVWGRIKPRETFDAIAWPLVIGVLLFEPHFFSHPMLPIGPHVWSGDEPHYLVMVNSLLADGDLDLANNYAAAAAGALDAGKSFAGRPLDHHTKWYVGDRAVTWYEYFETDPSRWDRDAAGHPIPRRGAGVSAELAPRREYSWHPPGLAWLLAILLYPFRGTELVESMALVCSWAATAGAMLCFQQIAKHYAPNADAAWLATAVAFLGTPAWHYGRTLFTEPYLLACATAAYAVAFRRRWFLVSGCLVALGVSMKPPFAMVAVPLAVGAAVDRRLISVVNVTLPSCAAFLALAALNQQMHGAWSRSPLQWVSANLAQGASGMIFSWANGIVPMAPAVLVALASWPAFLRAQPREGLQLAAAFLLYFCLMSAWVGWHGGACYGPRMIVPVLPLLFAALAFAPRCRWWRFLPARLAAVVICLVSVAINAVGAIASSEFWNRNPLDFIGAWWPFS